MNLKPSNHHFCILPWIQPHLHQNGKVTPCCKVHHHFQFGNLQDSTLEETWNSKEAKEMRKSFLNGDAHEACKECWNQEKSGLSSLRTEALKWYAEDLKKVQASEDGTASLEDISCLDIRFSNLCNFKCRSCSEEYSTSWDMNPFKHKSLRLSANTKENFWEMLDRLIPNLKVAYIAGGEPTIDPDHFQFLQKLLEKNKTDVSLIYNTNVSHLRYKNHDLIEIWKKFKEVQISMSLDATSEAAEILRKGTDWSLIERNINTLKQELPMAKLVVNPTVSAMNVFHLPRAIEEWIASGILDEKTDFQVNMVVWPIYLCVNILNDKERAQLSDIYAELLLKIEKSSKPYLLERVKSQVEVIFRSFTHPSAPYNRNLFRYVTFAIDKKRGENLGATFPELFDLLYQDPNHG